MAGMQKRSRRSRHQRGTVQQRARGGKKLWFGLWRDENGKRQITGPLEAKTKSDAREAMAEFMRPINLKRKERNTPVHTKLDGLTLGEYCAQVYLPFGEGKWKGSTKLTTSQRIRQHLCKGELSATLMRELDREKMQQFLSGYGEASLGLVNHLRFDLQAICRLAVAAGLMRAGQAEALYSPRTCKLPSKPVMTAEEVKVMLSVLGVRERAFCRLAIYAGMRPGEIIALRWEDIQGTTVLIDDRVYKGVTDETKTRKVRKVGLSASVVKDLELWQKFALDSEYVFASENLLSPVKYENLWQRSIQPKLVKVGLGWADFRCMRRTNSTLMKAAGADVKVSADQRGHGVNTSLNEYTQSTQEQMQEAVRLLEELIH